MARRPNPYFEIRHAKQVRSIEALLALNAQRRYYEPGSTKPVRGLLNVHSIGRETAGLFRGQLANYPLVPKAFRDYKPTGDDSKSVVHGLRWFQATGRFHRFCERAETQHAEFPSAERDRMCIAQHFGVPTPLLDWTRNVFAALFFAAREVFSNESFQTRLRAYVYHIPDEALLGQPLAATESLMDLRASRFVKPLLSDRRIERQRGVFTFHPHPLHAPAKVPVDVYVCGAHMLLTAIEIMKGMGLTEDYYFPDYAGIASAVMSETAL